MNSTISSRLMFPVIILLLLSAKNADAQVIWEDSFTNDETATTEQRDTWAAFKAQLAPEDQYFSMQISGSLDLVGITCSDPAKAADFANLLNTDTSGIVSCDGHEWSFCDRFDGEVWIDPPDLCNVNNCPSPGYIIRLGIGNPNWGGVGTATCNENPSQTMRLEFNSNFEPPKPVPTLSTWGLILLVLLLGFGVYGRFRRTV